MQKNKDKQYLSVVQMDDPVMILAVKEGLLEKITPAKVPNLAALKPGTIHMDGMWANYLQPWHGIAYNKGVPNGVASWGDVFDPKYKGRVILPSLQNTEGLANLFIASHLETGKPMAEALKDTDAGFKKLAKLKPNLLTIYTQMPQAFNLLEQGEAFMIVSAISVRARAQGRRRADRSCRARRKASSPGPPASASSRARPQPSSPSPMINEMLGAELQAKMSPPTFALPTNKVPPPPACRPASRSTPSTGRTSPRTGPSGSNAGTARWRSEPVRRGSL